MTPDDVAVTFLTDGGQEASATLERLIGFLDEAQSSLDLALYDVHLEPAAGDRLLAAFDQAEKRGVQVRAVYNDERRSRAVPPPITAPSLLARLAAAVPSSAIPGIPDLMHHKYVVRDADAVWTGSTNWTDDAWSRMENVIVIVRSADLAAAYAEDFNQLWERKVVEGTGRLDDEPARVSFTGAPLTVRAMFSPGRGVAIGHTIAAAIGSARRRVRICSPVLTSGPILSALAELFDDERCDASITVDGPQMEEALHQWAKDGRARWKVPLFERIRASGRLAEKPSRPYQAGPPHDYMHAKLVVCDDVVFTGSYNCSHSGEMNAENVLEMQSAELANQCAAFCEGVSMRYHHDR